MTYEWKRSKFPDRNFDEGQEIGFIAQELVEVLPEAVSTDASGYYIIDYGRLTPFLLSAAQEQ